ncbi:MAG: cobalamin-dependent protein [Nitrospiraceae bacterium]|nr:cobalamin-dependent protein [Nitrospiraceae bacterium]
MKVLMISTNRNRLPVPVMPAGACLVSEAVRRAGHEVKFLDLMFEPDPARAIAAAVRAFAPDIAGVSIRNIDNNDMQNPRFYAADDVRCLPALYGAANGSFKKNRSLPPPLPVVLGGPAVPVMPAALLRLSGADCAVISDGETVLPLLLERFGEGRSLREAARLTPGTAWLEDGALRKTAPPGEPGPAGPVPEGLVPVCPDYGNWIDVKKYAGLFSTAPLQSKTGCEFNCIYCTYRKIEGGRYRLCPPELAAEAVRRLCASGIRDIEFVDNVFNSPYEHAIAVCEEISRLPRARPGGRPRLQTIELNPLFIDDTLVDEMERAGFVGAGVTAESASGLVLAGLGKGYGEGHVHKAAEVMRRHDMPCFWIFLLGGPGETKATVKKTLDFASRCIRPSDPVFFNIGIRIYPGTGLERIARKEGLLSLGPGEMLEPVFYISPELSPGWIISRINSCMGRQMNFINSGSLGLKLLPRVARLFHRLGMKPPLWRHTVLIRGVLRGLGLYNGWS